MWDTNTGEELLTLEGHKNVVYGAWRRLRLQPGHAPSCFCHLRTAQQVRSISAQMAPTDPGIRARTAIAFNNPYGDKIITGSFDKTCKLWNAVLVQRYKSAAGITYIHG